MRGAAILEVKNVSKRFPGTQALADVSLRLHAGSIHAVVGENGAGKSTLMNVIAGVYAPDSGSILIDGREVRIDSPYAAQKLGVGFVHQEIALCQHLSVAENIFMSTINDARRAVVPMREYSRRSTDLLSAFGARIEARQRVSQLSISQQQVVEIAKALSMNCRLIILDEPTAALTESETEALFAIVKRLRDSGMGILYISHRMREVFENCDTVTILRDGRHIDTVLTAETTPSAVVDKMVGRAMSDMYPPKLASAPEQGDVLLDVRDLASGGDFSGVSFQLHRGEILGFFGLTGAGRSEVAKTICGLQKRTSGEVFLQGAPVRNGSYGEAIRHGLVYLTEDRKTEGLFLPMSMKHNICALDLRSVAVRGILDPRKEAALAEKYMGSLGIRATGILQKAWSLSGGNQQKVLIAKLLSVQPRILFMDEPTRGIDVGAKSEIHRLLRDLAQQGIGIVMISSELPEVIGLCDRVLVMQRGATRGVIQGVQLTEESVIRRASGL
ncbi:MAG TPA: sugar ABC transporter ATP-binding protein [Spirochaetia bacterium]|nr:sugar ABC transporter ATP-binding protein [Spirochaetia bacterium]